MSERLPHLETKGKWAQLIIKYWVNKNIVTSQTSSHRRIKCVQTKQSNCIITLKHRGVSIWCFISCFVVLQPPGEILKGFGVSAPQSPLLAALFAWLLARLQPLLTLDFPSFLHCLTASSIYSPVPTSLICSSVLLIIGLYILAFSLLNLFACVALPLDPGLHHNPISLLYCILANA